MFRRYEICESEMVEMVEAYSSASNGSKPNVSGSLLTDDYIRKITDDYANQYYSKDANPISHESLTEPFIDGFKKAMELLSNGC